MIPKSHYTTAWLSIYLSVIKQQANGDRETVTLCTDMIDPCPCTNQHCQWNNHSNTHYSPND